MAMHYVFFEIIIVFLNIIPIAVNILLKLCSKFFSNRYQPTVIMLRVSYFYRATELSIMQHLQISSLLFPQIRVVIAWQTSETVEHPPPLT
jgi:hypothetical protein